MKLYIHSKDQLIKDYFFFRTTLVSVEQADVVFIDWSDSSLMKIFDSANKLKKKYIIFDRNLSISPGESNTLRQKGAVLCEPALNFRRKFFNYLPYWIDVKDINGIKLNTEPRTLDLVFKGPIQDKISSFNKYYIPYANEYPNSVVVDDTAYNNRSVIKNDFKFSEAKATIVIGSDEDYAMGYLDQNFVEALNNNCIPLVVPEHKYFSSFSPYYLANEKFDPFDIRYITENYERTYIGWLLGIHETIRDYYPEMKVENVVQQIIDLV